MARLLRRPLLRRARPVAVAVFVMAPLLGAWSARRGWRMETLALHGRAVVDKVPNRRVEWTWTWNIT